MATKKQLAALAKARAARSKGKPKPRVKPKTNPIDYGVFVTTREGEGWLSGWTVNGAEFDTLQSRALKLNRGGASALNAAIYTSKVRGIKTVEVKVLSRSKKK